MCRVDLCCFPSPRHEHLYERISANVIQSDNFKFVRRSMFDGCQVVLCTLAMLSSRSFQSTSIRSWVPLTTLVVDEASQIEIGNYLPVFTRYLTIRKVCFIGDDKQRKPLLPSSSAQAKSSPLPHCSASTRPRGYRGVTEHF